MKKKKVLFVTENTVSNKYSGGSITARNILLSLYKDNDITCLIINNKKIPKTKDFFLKKKNINFLNFTEKQNNNNFIKKFLNFFFLREKDIFWGEIFKKDLEDLTLKNKFDVVICYHWEAIALCHHLKKIKKIAIFGDPLHKTIKYRINLLATNLLKKMIYNFSSILKRKQIHQYSAKILSNYNFRFAFSKGHANDFINYNIKCNYLRTPIENNKILKSTKSSVLKILHVGHLQGTTSIDSFKNLLFEYVPEILKFVDKSKIIINIVGPFNKLLINSNPNIKKKLKNYSFIKFVGPVYPIEKAYKNNDLILVCNRIPLGIRIRILTAFSFGFPVVSTYSNRFGIPEMNDFKNCLIGKNTKELVKKTLIIKNNNHIKSLIKKNSLKLQRDLFSYESFKKQLMNLY